MKYIMDTWTPIERIQDNNPEVVRCVNFLNDEKLFASIGNQKYMMVGSTLTITIENMDIFLEDNDMFENELENNEHFHPIKNVIPKDKFDDYIESCEFKNAAKEIGVTKLDICAICQDEITSGIVGITPCSHVFHKKCIKQWLTKECIHPTCPTCQTDVRSE